MISVNIHEAKARLSELIGHVQAGETVTICNRNVPVAELRPTKPKRVCNIGFYKGKAWMADDAFDPMTDEELAEWEKPLL